MARTQAAEDAYGCESDYGFPLPLDDSSPWLHDESSSLQLDDESSSELDDESSLELEFDFFSSGPDLNDELVGELDAVLVRNAATTGLFATIGSESKDGFMGAHSWHSRGYSKLVVPQLRTDELIGPVLSN
jgi:hypothetical protein